MKKFLSVFFFIATAIFVVILDRSFFPALGGSFLSVNLTLSLAIYLLIIIDRNLALAFFLTASLLLILLGSTLSLSSLFVGIPVLVVMDWVFESFLTNRSYYTLLILGGAGWYSYYFVITLLILFYRVLQLNMYLPVISFSWVSGIAFGSLFLMAFLSVAFIGTNFLSKKFKSYFIIS